MWPFLCWGTFPSICNWFTVFIMNRHWIFPKASKEWVKSHSRVWLFATPWTIAYQATPSMGFSRQEYWSGLPFPSPGDLLPNPGIEPGCPTLQADALPSEPPGKLLMHLLIHKRKFKYTSRSCSSIPEK